MADTVRYDIADRVAIVTIDNPPVNVLGAAVWAGIGAAVARAAADPGVDAVVVIGAGSTFVAGADINVFRTLDTREKSLAATAGMHALLRALEDSPKPVVAAIHGNALGGGLELAMSCHYRISVKNAAVGQPEVLLGLIPGAGGTQRLPRLCGAETALAMCLDGRPIPAAKAAAAGIIDQIVEGELSSAAVAFARGKAAAGSIRRTRDIAFTSEAVEQGLAACGKARAALRPVPSAPFAVAGAIEAALTLDFDAGSVREQELFAECLVSTESRAMRHLFFAERDAAKVPGIARDTPTIGVGRAGVIGAGTMGGGIAMTFANAGIPVLLKDADEAALRRGMSTIRGHYEASAAKGKMTPDQVARTMALITPTLSYDGFGELDVVVEAVFEDLDLKKRTFADLGRVTKAGCLLATNTSTLDVDQIGVASTRPAEVVGLHFFSPANVMKLVEIVRAERTSPSAVASALKLGKRLGKVPVVVGNCFGFVANRLLGYYLREAQSMLEEGASVAAIDRVMTDFGMPVGPFGMEDMAGLDIGARVRQHLTAQGRTWADGPQSVMPDRLVAMGRYGQKSGAGWYRYEPGSRQRVPDPLIDTLAAEAAVERGIVRRSIGDEEILARIMTALAVEGARVLEEGYALRAGDIDVIYAYGFGFPRYRGGPMFYAETVGLATVLDRVREYRVRLGPHWRPAPLLERLVREGRGFQAE